MRNYFTIAGLIFLSFSCKNDKGPLRTFFSLPNNLKEVSGIIYDPATELLWALEDGGNKNEIYGFNSIGEIAKTIIIDKTNNIDWEDITKDDAGNLYIGEFGNNDNLRKDLCIYKINVQALKNTTAIPEYKISFAYPEQQDFPPIKKNLFYDVESFFEFKNNFYLFTKNRSKGFDGLTLLYRVPNASGFHKAELLGKFKTCDDYNYCVITSAAISPDGTKVVILSHDRLWLLENFNGDNFLNGTITLLDLNHFSQKEAICFKDNETLLIADEKVKKIGGNVYEVRLKKLKNKS